MRLVLTEISDAHSRQDFFVNPEDVSSREPVGTSRSRQVSDVGRLRVGFVFVRLGPVSGVESDKGRSSALAVGTVTASLIKIKSNCCSLQ